MRHDLERLAAAASKQRHYAGFFHWGDKPAVERRVVEEMVQALHREGLEELSAPTPHSPDPPDITCKSATGAQVAIEVVEAVSEDATRLGAKGQHVYRHWGPGEFARHVIALIEDKDAKRFHGGPYERIIICVHTDEPAVTVDDIRAELRAMSLPKLRQVSSAYLLFSYDPHTKSYPVLPIPHAA